jgi:hypothetical protein
VKKIDCLRRNPTENLDGLLIIQMFEGLPGLPKEEAVDGADDTDLAEGDFLVDEFGQEGTIVIDPEGGFTDESSVPKHGLFVAELVFDPESALADGDGEESGGVGCLLGASSEVGDEALVQKDGQQTLVQATRWHRNRP